MDFLAGIPVAERFSFCLHTLLSDIAAKCCTIRDEIITSQVECLQTLTNTIKQQKDHDNLTVASRLQLCRSTVPVLIGIYSFGRVILTLRRVYF